MNIKSSPGIQCLILSPTRELAVQINHEANMYCNGTKIRARYICGGVAIWHQKATLKVHNFTFHLTVVLIVSLKQ